MTISMSFPEEHTHNVASKKIALIICSTRSARIGPQLAAWLSTHLPTTSSVKSNNTPIELTTIDLATYLPTLPLSPNNSILPYYVPTPLSPSPYDDAATNAWSRVIRQFDGFIWLTPEYNWSFPAGVKVATDLLFHEWKGKPMLIASYGNEGGSKAGKQLREVLRCVRCHAWNGNVELPLGYGLSIERAVKGELIPSILQGWERDGKGIEIERVWNEMIELVTRDTGIANGNGSMNGIKGGPLVKYEESLRNAVEVEG